MEKLTATRLHELLQYDPATGVFTWLTSNNGHGAGAEAGHSLNPQGYRAIWIDGQRHVAHRLAFLWVECRWPIDHVNGVKADNRWCNLREATRSQNLANARKGSRNTSGHKGVSWNGEKLKWAAQIMVNGKRIRLGYFDTPEHAFVAYALAAREHRGAFARIADGRWAPMINKIITRLERLMQ